MKKAIVLSLFLLLVVTAIFATGTPRTFYQKVVAADGSDILSIITNTGTTTNANYQVTVDDITATPAPGSEVLSTGVTPVANLRIFKTGVSPNFYAVIYLQLSTFPQPWVAGDVLHFTVTYIGSGVHNGESVAWDYTIPTGTGLINILTPTVAIPPQTTTDPNPTLATTPVPANGATGVLKTTASLSWTYTHNAAYTDPAGYRVYFGTQNPPTSYTWVPGMDTQTMNLPALDYATTYYWKVVPTTISGKEMSRAATNVTVNSRAALKSMAKGDAVGAAVWSFTTENAPVVTSNIQVTSNIAGVPIIRNTIVTGFVTPHTFVENNGDHVMYAVGNIPTMVTPEAQELDVASAQTLTFIYTNHPTTGVTYGSHQATVAEVAAAAPITVPAAGGYNFTFTPHAAGLVVFTVVTPTPTKNNNSVYAGYQNVWQVFQAYTPDATILNGTDVSIQYTNDLPYEVAVNWGQWYPHVGPWSGYLFNNGPATSLSLPLVAFGANSNYVDAATNTLTMGPLPTIAAGPYTLELVLNDGDHTLPVELSSFTAAVSAQMFVNLQWVTESETNSLGFNVLRSTSSDIHTAEKINATLIAGTNSESQHSYSFIDNDVAANTTYYYWLEMVALNGTSQFSNNVLVNTNPGVTPPPTPTVTTMGKAYPNPFSMNHSTRLNVSVKANETATVTVYNILGQAVKTWNVATGNTTITWDGKDSNGNARGCGIYFAKLTSPSTSQTTKMVIVK